jgi:aminoglycoside phosphotransferase (APT) family kinase protein
VAGAAVTHIQSIPGGASRQSYILTFAEPSAIGGTAFLRSDHGGGPMSDTIFTLQREARLLEGLAGTAVRVARIHAASAELDAILMEYVPGSSDYGGLTDPATRRQIERELIDQLATLHGLDVDVGAAFGGHAAATISEVLRNDLATWRGMLEQRVPSPDPLILFALDWLDRHALAGDRKPVIVHGDIGPGNFMFDRSGITALIDWEIAHPGHPLEDVACIIARTLGVPFGTPETLIADYATASGMAVDRSELRYCLILVLVRFSIGIAIAMARGGPTLDVPILVKFRQVNLRALVSLLMEAEGLSQASDPDEVAQGSELAMLYDFAIGVLGSGAEGTDDAFIAHRMRGAADLLRYLRDCALVPPTGLATDMPANFAAWIAAADDEARRDMLARLFDISEQKHRLMREALGPMFDRRLEI